VFHEYVPFKAAFEYILYTEDRCPFSVFSSVFS
jgi:hypothetical protein